MELYSLPEAELQKLIIHASAEGRPDVIAKVLQANSRLRSCVDEDGLGPLHHAVLRSQVDAVRSLLRAGVPTFPEATSGAHAGKTARQLAGGDGSIAAAIRGAFAAELLQSVMLGNVDRTADLLRAGVGPEESVGPGIDSQSLLAFAEELSTDDADANPAVELLRAYARQGPGAAEVEVGAAAAELDAPGGEASEKPAPPSPLPRAAAASEMLPRPAADAAQVVAKQLEEKDALIDRLRSMLSEMADEQVRLQAACVHFGCRIPLRGSLNLLGCCFKKKREHVNFLSSSIL
jgi:hypothetical protein